LPSGLKEWSPAPRPWLGHFHQKRPASQGSR